MPGISIPTQDPYIDRLLQDLEILVKKLGKDSQRVIIFVEDNKDAIFVDKQTGCMHSFSEIAFIMIELFNGLHFDPEESEADPADWWKS